MKACGLIVEYNPFHYGHLYHLEQSKEKTNADCMIAVMSGDFLQRGEPAIIDKWHRASIALDSGIDIVVELPYAFAVQSADLFAKGAMLTLNALQVSSVCFGSEQGNIAPFRQAYETYTSNQASFEHVLKEQLKEGLSFPEASRFAYKKIGLTEGKVDLGKPNNILGFSYVKAIYQNDLSIIPSTIERTKSGYHDPVISNKIASATSIRKEILDNRKITEQASSALPTQTVKALRTYKEEAGVWHHWELYYPLLHYRVITMSLSELQQIAGIDEGLEYRLKKTVSKAKNFHDWMERLKTKRYTWTRIQRAFAHILTNTKKVELKELNALKGVPYVRLLGMTKKGQAYINHVKKDMEVPLISQIQQGKSELLELDERAVNSYASILSPDQREKITRQEITPPIIKKA